MKALQIIPWLFLLMLILPSLLFLAGRMTLPEVHTWMLWATILWFALSIASAYFRSKAAGSD